MGFFSLNRRLHDCLYDVNSPPYRELFDWLVQHDFEIGLHASYNAYRDSRHFFQQKRRLEQLSGTSVLGLRHHYWHVGSHTEQTLLNHEAAGFKYDTSVAFENHVGFRRSVAFPYHVWHPEKQRAIQVLQIPVFCMDGNFMYDSRRTAEQADQIFIEILAAIKQYHGIACIDWHSDTSNERTPNFEHWGQMYRRILELLAADSTIWVTKLEDMYTWFTDRNQKLNDLAHKS